MQNCNFSFAVFLVNCILKNLILKNTSHSTKREVNENLFITMELIYPLSDFLTFWKRGISHWKIPPILSMRILG